MKPTKRKLSVKVKGYGNALLKAVSPIPYRQIVDDADWTRYFGTSVEERQKYGRFDTSDCYEFSVIKQIEMQLNALLKRGEFTPEALNFFIANKYVDNLNQFNISDQFYDCLSGNYDNGGTAEESFQLIQKYGIIPHSMLFCTDEIANRYGSQQAFNNYYYAKSNVTPAMLEIGKQSLKYFRLDYQRIGKLWTTPDDTLLTSAMKQAPLAYGVPVNYTWNQTNVPSLVQSTMEHEVTGYKASQGMTSYGIVDNYAPFIKNLIKLYSLNSVMQGVVVAIPTTTPVPFFNLTIWQKVWLAVHEWFVDNKLITQS